MSNDARDTAMDAVTLIREGRTALGIELGSTRIKACLVAADDPSQVLAAGGFAWENRYENRLWTYPLDQVWTGLQTAFAALVADARERHGVAPTTFGALGISAMMHGYLAFDEAGETLAEFRTWRNTNAADAAVELSQAFGVNIPVRWSIAHLHQAVRDAETHIPAVSFITTLSGYVHWKLTGEKVLGVGDASGMFPIDSDTHDYDASLLDIYDTLASESPLAGPVRSILPRVLVAGESAGTLTPEGAALLDPTGALAAGIPLCPPEGDAGTGMVATGAVAPRTGNVSAGTSIFAMVVLERPLSEPHHELDLVTTPAGDTVAMVHCNNGASELAAWADMFGRFAEVAGVPLDSDARYHALFQEALTGDPDAGGVVAYNYLAGEPITELDEGRPLIVRTPGSSLTLANFMRAQLYGVFGTLSLGMRVLAKEGVAIDQMFAHGGMFRTAGVAQRFLAAALDAPVAVGETAAEGGAWGVAVLAAYLENTERPLAEWLDAVVFRDAKIGVVEPDPTDLAGYRAYLERYEAGLDAERAAVAAL